MENSHVEVVNEKVINYVDRVFNEYTTHVTCPKDVESYKEWFTDAFLPCCITRWYEPSCYDINNMFTIEQFFDNSIIVFSDILTLLSDYFDGYGRTMDMDKFKPENVMRCYASIYVIRNINYFLDRYQDDELCNSTSETSDALSLDLFQPDLIENPIEVEENDTNNNTPTHTISVNIIGYDDTDREDDDNSSLPELINVIEDGDSNSDTLSLPELLSEDYELFETGVFVTENEFIEKNKNVECIICWDVVMNYGNSMKWNNCNHFSCITCHDACMIKNLYKCPLCRM